MIKPVKHFVMVKMVTTPLVFTQLLEAWPYVEMASWPAAYFEKNEAGVETT